MMRAIRSLAIRILAVASLTGGPASLSWAADPFTLSSPDFPDQGRLPLQNKCQRDGGQGLSPSLQWSSAPAGTKSFAVVMHHYPRGTVEGRHAPSQYWLLWNIPVETNALPPGNPESLGDEGADKDERGVGYTPPCSPGNATHSYTITLYALDAAPDTLGNKDDPTVDWSTLMNAIEDKVIASSALSFLN